MTLDAIHHQIGRVWDKFSVPVLPDLSKIFLERSRRFSALAQGHTLSGWLSFLSRLTYIQHDLLQDYPAVPLSDTADPELAGRFRRPPIPAGSSSRDSSWQQAAIDLARSLLPHAPPPAQATLKRLQGMNAPTMEKLADQVLQLELNGPNADVLPFIAAALQVYWTRMAAGLEQTKNFLPVETGVCPCCGYLPVAGLVRTDGEVAGLRYLHCALCNTEWHMVRVTCAACRDANRISYRYIAGGDGAVRIETCEECKGYLKILYHEKSPQADPIADDLATLALDVLADEAGYDRIGPNLLFTTR